MCASEPPSSPALPVDGSEGTHDAELDRAAAVLARVHVLEARVAMESEAVASTYAASPPDEGLVSDELSAAAEGEPPSGHRGREEMWRRMEEEAIKAEILRMEEEGRKARVAALEAAPAAQDASPQGASPRGVLAGVSGSSPEPSLPLPSAGLPSAEAEQGAAVGEPEGSPYPPSEAGARAATPALSDKSGATSRAGSPATDFVPGTVSSAGSASAPAAANPSRPGSTASSAAGRLLQSPGGSNRPSSAAASSVTSRSDAASRPRSVLSYASRPESAARESRAQSRPLSRATIMSSRAGRAMMEEDVTDRVAALARALPEDVIARAGELHAQDGSRILSGSVRAVGTQTAPDFHVCRTRLMEVTKAQSVPADDAAPAPYFFP